MGRKKASGVEALTEATERKNGKNGHGPAAPPEEDWTQKRERMLASTIEHLREKPEPRQDLVLWVRARFNITLEQAEDVVGDWLYLGDFEERDGKVHGKAEPSGGVAEKLLGPQGGQEPDAGSELPAEAASPEPDAPPADPDGEKVPLAEAFGAVAPEVVENPGAPEPPKAVLEPDDVRQAKLDAKRFADVLHLLERRKSLRAQIREAQTELKELKEDLSGVEAALDDVRRDQVPPATAPTICKAEPQDAPLPFPEGQEGTSPPAEPPAAGAGQEQATAPEDPGPEALGPAEALEPAAAAV